MDNRTIRLSDAIEAVLNIRHAAAGNFAPEFLGNQFEAYDRAVLDIHKALSALPAVGGWLDIESAPSSTGKETANLRVLAIGGIFAEATIVLADGEWWRHRAKDGARSIPTHWQPLPARPEIE